MKGDAFYCRVLPGMTVHHVSELVNGATDKSEP